MAADTVVSDTYMVECRRDETIRRVAHFADVVAREMIDGLPDRGGSVVAANTA